MRKTIIILFIVAFLAYNGDSFFRKISRGISRAGRGIARGVSRAGNTVVRGVSRAGKTVGRGVVRAGKTVGKGVETAGKTVGKGVVRTGKTVGKGVETAGKTVGKGVVIAGKTVGKGIIHGFNILTKGCCGLYSSYCENRDEFKKIKEEISKLSPKLDRDWASLKILVKNIKAVNNYNQVIYRETRRVTLASSLNAETLDPEIIGKMNNVSNDLKKAVRAKNQTVLDYGIDEIEKEMEGSEKQAQTKALDAATGIGNFQQYLTMTADMFRLVRLDKVAEFLESDVINNMNKAKGEVSKIFGFNYLDKLSNSNNAVSIALNVLSKYTSYLNVFGQAMALFNLFGSFVAWITDLATCKKRKNELEDALKKLKEKQKAIKQAEKDLEAAKTTANNNWNIVFNEAKSHGLLHNLKYARNIAEKSSSLSQKMSEAITNIDNYRKNVERASPSQVVNLQEKLIPSIANVTYNSECYERKLATYRDVTIGCKKGIGSFDELYERAMIDFRTNQDECKDQSGLPYTTKDDVKKYLKKIAKNEEFEENCMLNSGVKRKIVCDQLRKGYTLSEVVRNANVKSSIVEEYQSECHIQALSPQDRETICLLKPFKTQNQMISKFANVSRGLVVNALKSCTM